MDRDWLAQRLEAGESIEAIARAVERDPSTVAYWVNKHGLRSRHAKRHAPRGGLSREQLEPLIERGLTIRQIAEELDRGVATVRHWLRRYELKTRVAQRVRRDGSTAPEVVRDCPRHGWTWVRRVGAQPTTGAPSASSTPSHPVGDVFARSSSPRPAGGAVSAD